MIFKCFLSKKWCVWEIFSKGSIEIILYLLRLEFLNGTFEIVNVPVVYFKGRISFLRFLYLQEFTEELLVVSFTNDLAEKKGLFVFLCIWYLIFILINDLLLDIVLIVIHVAVLSPFIVMRHCIVIVTFPVTVHIWSIIIIVWLLYWLVCCIIIGIAIIISRRIILLR